MLSNIQNYGSYFNLWIKNQPGLAIPIACMILTIINSHYWKYYVIVVKFRNITDNRANVQMVYVEESQNVG
jgi:hypothetical protein